MVVGAGPAGSDLAWRLASAGSEVLLVDRLADLQQAAFSSAAVPQSLIEAYGIPAAVQAASWSRWSLIGPDGRERQWSHAQPLGAVLDFGALRQWLVQRAQRAGVQVRLGWCALGWQPLADGPEGALLQLRAADGSQQSVACRWVVDATGQQRGLIGDPEVAKAPLVSGRGVEWLLGVDQGCWERWSERLSFLLGSAWVPQGYGWVFPMQPGQLKLGVCRLDDRSRPQPPLQTLMQRLMERLELGRASVLDRHGGLIRSSIRRREPHRRGPVLAVGDAVSTANLLGGEGIRHALNSSAVLAPLLISALVAGRAERDPLRRYPRQLRRSLGWRWSLSGRLAQRTWLGLHNARADRHLERLLQGLEHSASAQDLSNLLFHYRFERYGLRALPYLVGFGKRPQA